MRAEFDDFAPHFKEARELWLNASTLENHYKALVDCYNGNQHGLIEYIKSYLECVCLTILGEFGKPMSSTNPSTTELLTDALKILGLKNSRGANKLDRVLSAYNKLSDALADMRNANGPIAHGKDGFSVSLTSNHLRTYILIVDNILALLLAAFNGTEPDLQFTREPYERFLHLHNRIDNSVIVESSIEYENETPLFVITLKTNSLDDGIELRIEPSLILYSIDRTAYIELLAASTKKIDSSKSSDEKIIQDDSISVISCTLIESSPSTEIVDSYKGILSVLVKEFRIYLSSLIVSEDMKNTIDAKFINSLLATAEANMGIDWMNRETLQIRMKIAIRRILNKFGFSSKDAKYYSEHIVKWLKIQTVGLSDNTGGADGH